MVRLFRFLISSWAVAFCLAGVLRNTDALGKVGLQGMRRLQPLNPQPFDYPGRAGGGGAEGQMSFDLPRPLPYLRYRHRALGSASRCPID